MSHIDQALKVVEGTSARTPESRVARPSGSSPLSEYPHEAPDVIPAELPSAPVSEPAQPERQDVTSLRTTRVAKRRGSAEIQARLVTEGSSSVALEQYRRLAAVLHDEQVHKQLKTVMITSAVPHEGKTLTVVNLALTLSGSFARRVLVIDADLRAPSVHSILGIRNDRGLTEALHASGRELPLTEVSDRLSVMTAGHAGPTPLAGLASERMGELLGECAARFDWVLIDTSPVGVLPDAQVLARLAGGVIFVIGAGSTPAAAVERAIAEIGPDAIIGTVLNRVDERRIHEASYYNKYGYYNTGRTTGSDH